jgi:hypothetical protein
MALEKIEVKIGDTWNPTIRLYADENKSVAYDATGYTLVCHIKEKLEEDATEIYEIVGSWTDEANGIGKVKMTHTQSKALRRKDYYFQFKIYLDSAFTVVKTVKQGILKMVEVLEKDIT